MPDKDLEIYCDPDTDDKYIAMVLGRFRNSCMALLLDGYNRIQQILLRIMKIHFKLETLLEVLWFSFLCRISLHIT